MTISASGYEVGNITDIRQSLIDSIQSDYPDLTFEPETFEGHIVDLVADRIYKLELKFQSLYNNTPSTAIGQALYSFGLLKGLTPIPAQPSILSATFVGANGATVPSDSMIKDNQGFIYKTISSITLSDTCDNKIFVNFSKTPTAGTWSLTIDDESRTFVFNISSFTTHPYVSSQTGNFLDGYVLTLTVNPTTVSVSKSSAFDAVVTSNILELDDLYKGDVLAVNQTVGNYKTESHQCNILVNNIVDVDYVYNALDSTEGTNDETDVEFFERMYDVSLANGNSLDGIKNRLMYNINNGETLDLIRKVLIKTHYGVAPEGAPNPLEVFVSGGVSRGQEIAEELRLNLVSAGITLLGDETYTVTDIDGYEHESKFSYVPTIDIYVNLEIETDSTYDGDDAVKNAIVQWGNSLGIGKDVIRLPGLISSISGINGITNVVLLELSDDGITYAESNISIDDYTESSWTTDNITITVV